MNKLYAVNYNDIIPDLSDKFEMVDVDRITDANVIMLWNDVVQEYALLCQEAKGYLGIPTVVMSHGRMALRDYICRGRIPKADHAFAWTDHEMDVAVDDGWQRKQLHNVGSPLWRYIPQDHKKDGKTVLFFPVHKLVKDNDRALAQSKRVWQLLNKINGINPKAKLCKYEHEDKDWNSGNLVWTNRRQPNHLAETGALFRDASVLVLQGVGSPPLFAHALKIPVIKVRNGLAEGENPEFMDGVHEVREEFLKETILDALANPEKYTKDAERISFRDNGDREHGLKIVENMAGALDRIIASNRKKVYFHREQPVQIGTFVNQFNACDYYRVTLPLSYITENTNIQGNLMGLIHTAGNIQRVLQSDLIILTRFTNPEMIGNVERMKAAGKKVIIDYDDNIFCLSPYSPHYDHLGTQNYQHVFPNGHAVDVWKDGVNIDLASNQRSLDAAKTAMGIVDAVTVTTDILAETYRPNANKVGILANCLDLTRWHKLPMQKHDDIRLFWGGGASHFEDWVLLEEVLPVIMEKYKNVRLIIMGNKFEGTVKRLPQDRIEHHLWEDVQAYPFKYAALDPDIALIPLKDTEFSRNKSCIKWLEAGALQIPAVTSYVSPYAEIATEENGIFIENNHPDLWIQGISMLIEDEQLRINTGKAARQYVEDHFDMKKRYQEWIDFYMSIIGG